MECTKKHLTKAVEDHSIRPCLFQPSHISNVAELLDMDLKVHPAGLFSVDDCPIDYDSDFKCKTLFTILPTILNTDTCPAEQRDQRQRLFLEACQRRECHGAALYAALLTGRLQDVQDILPLMTLRFKKEVLAHCSARNYWLGLSLWSTVLEALMEHPECGGQKTSRQITRFLFYAVTITTRTYDVWY